MVHLSVGPGEVEHGVGRDPKLRQVLLDASQSQFESLTAFPDLSERSLQQLHPVPPLVPFLDTQQDRIHVDHRAADGENANQLFGGGSGLDFGTSGPLTFKPDGG